MFQVHAFSRTELLIGREAIERLKNSKVAIFGIGGVGSFVVEALVRSAVGSFVLIDKDTIDITNLNRQLHANYETIGRSKVQVMEERIHSINPEAEVTTYQGFYSSDKANEILKDDYDYVVDAIDTVSSKIDLVVGSKEKGIPIISSMGAGNRMDPTSFIVADIYETSIDPIAKVMRRELRKREIDRLKVVYSTETPIKPNEYKLNHESSETKASANDVKRRPVIGSISFVPSTVGLIIASEVIKDLIRKKYEPS